MWAARLGRHHARKSNISCSLPFYLHFTVPLLTAYHPPSSRFKRSLATGRSRYTRTRGFCARKVLGFWTRSVLGSPQLVPAIHRRPPFSLSLSLDAPSLYNTTGEASLVNSPLYPYFDSGGHGALRNFAGCFAPRETNTPLSRSLLSSSLSRSLVPSFRFCLSIESFSTRFRIRSSFFIDWICFFFFLFIIIFISDLKISSVL